MSLIILKQLQDLKLQDLSQKKINFNNLEKLLERLKVSSLSAQHIQDIQKIRQHLEKIQVLNTATSNIVATKLQKINESKKRHDSISERLGNSKIALDRIRSLVNDCDKSIRDRKSEPLKSKKESQVGGNPLNKDLGKLDDKILKKIENTDSRKEKLARILNSPTPLSPTSPSSGLPTLPSNTLSNDSFSKTDRLQQLSKLTSGSSMPISFLPSKNILTNDQQKLNADFKKLMTDGQAMNIFMSGGNRGHKSKQARRSRKNKTNKHKNTRNTKTRKPTKNTRNTKARKATKSNKTKNNKN